MPNVPIPALASASPQPVIRLTDRQEAFCQAMACNTGGAEAARIAGYSAKGAKQRGAFLMRQPEIRVRIDQLRACRRAGHQTLLDIAADQVKDIITEALEKKSCTLALRAIEFRLKLCGVIQDRRIAHHYHLDHNHPDADLENLDPDFDEEFDAISVNRHGKPAALKAPAATPVEDTTTQAAINSKLRDSKPRTAAIAPPAKPATSQPKHPEPKRLSAAFETRIVTRNSDLSRLLSQSPAASCLFASTSPTALQA
jgi:hypothetical protein